jgi:hypothetical protein
MPDSFRENKLASYFQGRGACEKHKVILQAKANCGQAGCQ